MSSIETDYDNNKRVTRGMLVLNANPRPDTDDIIKCAMVGVTDHSYSNPRYCREAWNHFVEKENMNWRSAIKKQFIEQGW